jgi:Domain of unknown function (DUF4411)
VLVFDTSAYINGRLDHLPPATFPTVWQIVETAIDDGRIILPREVFRELTAQHDDIARWIRTRVAMVVEPSQAVQRDAGRIRAAFPSHASETPPTRSSSRRHARAASRS